MLKNMLPLFVFVLLASPLLATDTDVPESNVLGEECPELFLEEEMVQGAPLTQEDFERKVVLFVFYQRECDGCERFAMPRLQKLYEKYAHKHCVLAVAINTAFDKDEYPYLADVEETRKHLERMQWTMPVLRDLDEKSNALFELDEIAGTPQAVVLDVDGTVRAHDWFSEEREMERVEETFERLASRLNCHCIPMPRKVTEACKRARQAIKDGDYAGAYDQAKTITDSYGYTEEDKKDAEYLRDFVKEIADDRIERARKNFDYDPVTSIDNVEEVLEDFEGVEGVAEIEKELEEWRASDRLKDFNKLNDQVAEIEEQIGKADGALEADQHVKVKDRLRGILDKAGDSAIADRVRGHLRRMGEEVESADTVSKTDTSSDRLQKGGSDRASKAGADRIRKGGDSGASGLRPKASDGTTRDSVKSSSDGGGRISSHRSHR